MLNLIKYELKGYYKELAILIGCVVFFNLLLFTRLGVWPREAIAAASIGIASIAAVVVFVWNIAMYSRDLYGNTGYLLFTLPQRGYSILAAKFITALLQMVIVELAAGIFSIYNLTAVNDFNRVLQIARESVSGSAVFLGFLSMIYQYIYIIVFIYFCITLSRVAIGKRKLGKLGAFISFIVVSMLIGNFSDWLANTFPQSISMNIITPKGYMYLNQLGNVTVTPQDLTLNIAYVIFDLITLAAFYVGTSWLLEHKLDL